MGMHPFKLGLPDMSHVLKYVNTLMLGVKQQNFEQSQFFFRCSKNRPV